MDEENVSEKLNKGIRELKAISMTAHEKKQVLDNIFKVSPYMEHPVRSPYMHVFASFFNQKRFVYYGSALCLVLILGTGTVFASQGSLPGDALYSLKVKVLEPARGAFIFSPSAKAEYQSNLALKRLAEAEILAHDSKLDTSKEEELSNLLETHSSAFNSAVNKFHQGGQTDEKTDDDIITNFQANMNAHARILNAIHSDGNKNKDNAGEDREENADTKISKTAKDNAINARNNFRTKKTSDKSDEEINSDDEHEKLLDSESSAKETDIFLKSGL